MLKQLSILLILFFLSSCSFFTKKEEVDTRKPIAKVNNVYLYKEDLKSALPSDYKDKDSALFVNNYINAWAKKQLLLHKARLNLKNINSDIDDLVKNYREDLLINKYREAVVNQNLDTIVSDADIDDFYKKNKEILKLNEELLMLKFIQIDKEIIDKEHIEKLFKSNKTEDIESLIDKELEFKSFYFNDSTWIKFSDVIRSIPLLKKEEVRVSINNSQFLKKEDSLNIYLIKINKILKRNSISPKSYVLPTIKQMILHNRKLQLLKEIEKTLLNDANKNGQYEIFK